MVDAIWRIPSEVKADLLRRALISAANPPKSHMTTPLIYEFARRLETASLATIDTTPLTHEQRAALEADCREDLDDEDVDQTKRAESILLLCMLTLTTDRDSNRELGGAVTS